MRARSNLESIGQGGCCDWFWIADVNHLGYRILTTDELDPSINGIANPCARMRGLGCSCIRAHLDNLFIFISK
jgi:hypothetical protein